MYDFPLNEVRFADDKTIWRSRNLWEDLTQSWQNKFVAFASKVKYIRKDDLVELIREERAASLYG